MTCHQPRNSVAQLHPKILQLGGVTSKRTALARPHQNWSSTSKGPRISWDLLGVPVAREVLNSGLGRRIGCLPAEENSADLCSVAIRTIGMVVHIFSGDASHRSSLRRAGSAGCGVCGRGPLSFSFLTPTHNIAPAGQGFDGRSLGSTGNSASRALKWTRGQGFGC